MFSCVATGLGWCFCTAAASLLGSCCGNDKPSSEAPGAHSGRKRSVFLLLIAIAIAFIFQYGVAPAVTDAPVSNYVTDAWLDGCEKYDEDILVDRCAGQAGVYRSAFSSTLFFILAAIGVACKPSANREAWIAKYTLFFFLELLMCFIPNEPLFLDVYLNIGRVGAALFIFIQQVILVDLAFNWNDSWVERSNKAEAEEVGSGRNWLIAIVVSAAMMFITSFVGWGLMIHYFAGCPDNNAFIAITIVLCVIITGAQLSGGEGSLLASSLITLYATSLCYSAVSKNPDRDCNPFLGEDDFLGIFIGVGFTVVALGYAGWSFTADQTFNRDSQDEIENSNFDYRKKTETTNPDGERKVTGVVTYGANNEDAGGDEESPSGGQNRSGSAGDEEAVPNTFSNSWRLNVILAIVSCWFAMSLTGWGAIKSGGTAANPQVGDVSMWMIIVSQWLVLLMYLWTLIAPRVFPDRDFS
uniref:Serine incorporator n=2 Tax=Craspedostauros australis TaxID=1486917 RepID=A0A7R9X0V1_9STRA|mmetsp:Transcript_4851/g.12731  ORF Transcript_4851/g.12731 Transcript_4851/m.12731 type:complete len:469 (+) Transcript_4851:346-1752(+)